MKPACLFLPLTCLATAAGASDIDLDCKALAEDMVDRLSSQGLLVEGGDSHRRAEAITLELCGGAEVSAQEQLEENKKQWHDNWFFEERAEKPGNKRLRNLKR